MTVNVAIELFTEAVVSASDAWEVHDLDSDTRVTGTTAQELIGRPRAELAASLLDYFTPSNPVRVSTRSQAPPHSGLGGSSSLGISIAFALNRYCHADKTPYELIQLVRDVEAEVLGGPTGEQDHFPPVYGGAQRIRWGKGGPERTELRCNERSLTEHTLLAYTHQPHRSGANNWQAVKRFLDGDTTTRAALSQIGVVADAIARAVDDDRWDEVSRLYGEEWAARQQLAPEVKSPELDALMNAANDAGASGAKACGAGGGGCFLVGVRPAERKRVAEAIERAGGTILDLRLSRSGVVVDTLS